ncbi:MAG TPA: peptidoglycan-binding domain-containing protein [Acidobacteriota bacterium]|jgi:hypothetical protein
MTTFKKGFLLHCMFAAVVISVFAAQRVTRGTELTIRLRDSISSHTNKVGDTFSASVTSPSQFNDAVVTGHIASINKSGKFEGRTSMRLAFDSIQYTDGESTPFRGEVVQVRESGGDSVSRVDPEGRVESHSRGKQTIKRGGIGAATGAVIGAIAGGAKGAAIGILVGGAAGAGSIMAQGSKDLDLPVGTELSVRTIAAPQGKVMSSSSASDIQRALKDKGYYTGAIDGKIGPATRRALMNFQRDNNLPVTGRADDKTREALGVR